jgi:hypothetical protein
MANNPTKEGNFKEADTVQSTEWSLRCLAHQKNILTFEVMNLKTNRAHRMIFKGSGTDDITKQSYWTDGVLAEKFKTNFPVSFENFDETLAMLTPRAGSAKYMHVLRIGWLATFEVCQPHGEGYGTWYLYGICRIEYGSGEAKNSRVYPYSAGGGMGKVSMSPGF